MMGQDQLTGFLTKRFSVRTFDKGEYIFNQGEAADGCFFQKSGLSRTFIVSPDGNERSIITNLPGAIFGASSWFSRCRRRSSASAISRCEIINIPGRQLQELVRSQPDFTETLFRAMSEDIGVLFDQLGDTKLYTSGENTARFLCRCIKTGQSVLRDGKPCVTFSQRLIAESMGVSRWTVSRAFDAMKENGWIATGYEEVRILNLEALTEYAGELL